MTNPAKEPSAQGPRAPVAKDRRALQPYLRVQLASDKEMAVLLRDALNTVTARLKHLEGNESISYIVRRDQLLLIKREILKDMSALWREVGKKVQAGRYLAAEAAVDSVAVLDRPLFERAGVKGKQIRRALTESQKATARASVDLAKTRLQVSRIDLAQSVYKAEKLSTGIVDRTVNAIIATGGGAKDIARAVRPLINPRVPGGVSYSAMRLGRTELNNAFHAQQVATMAEEPWVEAARWNLSSSHPLPDLCDQYAKNSLEGFPLGSFKVGDVPRKPHPQCLCFITAELIDETQFLEQLNAGRYDAAL